MRAACNVAWTLCVDGIEREESAPGTHPLYSQIQPGVRTDSVILQSLRGHFKIIYSIILLTVFDLQGNSQRMRLQRRLYGFYTVVCLISYNHDSLQL